METPESPKKSPPFEVKNDPSMFGDDPGFKAVKATKLKKAPPVDKNLALVGVLFFLTAVLVLWYFQRMRASENSASFNDIPIPEDPPAAEEVEEIEAESEIIEEEPLEEEVGPKIKR